MNHRPTTRCRRGPRRDRGRGAVVVVIVIAVVGVTSLAGWAVSRPDDPDDGVVVAAGLSRVLDEVDYESGVAFLDECPVLDTDVLLEAVGAEAEVDPAVVDGERSATAYTETPGFPAGVFCNAFAASDAALTSGAVAVSLSVTMTPVGEYDDFLLAAFDNESTDLGAVSEWRGAQVHPYCVSAADEQGQTGCGADWVHDDAQVAVGVYLAGERDQAAAVRALEATLPEVVAALDTSE